MKKTIGLLISIMLLNIASAEEPNSKPLVLFDAANKAKIEPVDVNISFTNAGSLLVQTEPNKEFPGVIFKPNEGQWDLSNNAKVSAQLTNVGTEPVRLYLRIDNPNANMWSNSNLQAILLNPGQKRNLSTFVMLGPWRFDKPITLIGLRGAPGDKGGINASKVTQVCIFSENTKTPQRFEIESIKAEAQPESPLGAEGQFQILNADKFIPFIDQFGQFIHNNWPGKTHSLEELQEHRESEEKQLAENPGPDNWDKFGGYKNGPKLNATGFFRVEKYQGNWWLVDPDGYLFWSHGIDCVRMNEATPITDRENYFANLPDVNSPLRAFYGTGTWAPHGYYQQHSPYKTYDFSRANLMRKYGDDWQRISAEFAHKRLRSWGLNTIANWSNEAIYSLRKTPYVATIGYEAKKIEGSSGYWGKFYDVFDPSFRQSLRARLEQEKGKSAGDPWCVGFFVDNELSWGDETSLGLATLASSQDQQAKKMFVDDLKAKYQTIEKLNAVWDTNFANWETLLQNKFAPPNTEQSAVPPSGKENWAKTKAFDDLSAFYTKTAQTYFAVVREEVKRIATNQLYLGCRFAWVNDLAIRASAKYCDVVSFNFYDYGVEGRKLPDNIDMPTIIGEFHFGALDRGMFHPGLKRAADQNDRADKYSEYVRGALGNPYIVGTHWFQYQDQPTTGRGDGENYQIGFVDVADTPYPETIAASQNIGKTMYDYRLKNK